MRLDRYGLITFFKVSHDDSGRLFFCANFMDLVNKLAEKKQEIVREWIRKTMEAYPAESVAVLNRNKDRFANPLSHIISENIDLLFDELIKGIDPVKVAPILDKIVRIRAVQDFIPSKGIYFIFELKEVIRKVLKKEIEEKGAFSEIPTIEKRIDQMALLAFDIYVSCKEKLYQIQANETRNQTHMLIRRVNEMDKQKEAR